MWAIEFTVNVYCCCSVNGCLNGKSLIVCMCVCGYVCACRLQCYTGLCNEIVNSFEIISFIQTKILNIIISDVWLLMFDHHYY